MDPSLPDRRPLFAALFCFTLWGVFPLLFQAMGQAGAKPLEMLCWRTVAAVPCAGLLVAVTGQTRPLLDTFANPRRLAVLASSAAMISVNWGVYIWAVNQHHTLAASLGYYINPLMNVAASALFFGERLKGPALAAVGLAAAGVALQAWAVGEPPWVSLILAASFCAYAVIRKKAAVEAQTGLLVECLILAVPAAAFLLWFNPGTAFGHRLDATALLLLGGPATVVPLFLFAYAARRLTLTYLGFLQFIAPTFMFVIGAAQGEPLSGLRLASFAFIWAGVALFAWDGWRKSTLPSAGGGSV
jgi:chloramphenicol-sensitive protein RarD